MDTRRRHFSRCGPDIRWPSLLRGPAWCAHRREYIGTARKPDTGRHPAFKKAHQQGLWSMRRLYTFTRRAWSLLLQQRYQAPGVGHRCPAVSRQLRGRL